MIQRSMNQPQTLLAIQKQHEELLSQKASKGEVEVEQVQLFLTTIAQAGKSIESSQERSVLRDLIRYWSVIIDDKTGELPIIQLQPFDSSLSVNSVPHHSKLFLQGASEEPIPALGQQNRQRLIKRMRSFWIGGVLEHSLYQTALISPDLYEQPGAIENPWRLAVQETDLPLHPLPPGTNITQVYDQTSSGLLILGAPGSGKTTLLLELARVLLDRAERDTSHPVPIVFNLSSWATERQLIEKWLVEELTVKYQVPRKLGQTLVATGQLLLLLDGLDEAAPIHRASCVDAINTYIKVHSLIPMVVCSRSIEYSSLANRLQLSNAVVIQPLTTLQIATYLENTGEKLAKIRSLLQNNLALLELVRTPLMLNVLILAFSDESLSDLPSTITPDALQQQIFAYYVRRTLERRGASTYYTQQETTRWLSWLAFELRLRNQTIFYIERMQPDSLSESFSHKLYRAIVTGLICMLIIGLVIGLALTPLVGLFFGMLAGAFDGLFWGLIIASLVRLSTTIQPAEIIIWSWTRLRDRLTTSGKLLATAFISGLPGGLTSGLINGALSGLTGGFVNGAFSALIAWLTFILLAGTSCEKLDERNLVEPNQGIWRALRNGVLIGLLVGLFSGTLSGLIVGLRSGLLSGVLSGLIVGLSCGLLGALLRGGSTYIKHFVLRLLLWRKGYLPWNYSRFLDYAVERILLVRIGGGYMFVHRLLLEHFATLNLESNRSKTEP